MTLLNTDTDIHPNRKFSKHSIDFFTLSQKYPIKILNYSLFEYYHHHQVAVYKRAIKMPIYAAKRNTTSPIPKN